MKRTMVLVLIVAMMLIAAACAEETTEYVPVRTATPMESISPAEALDVALAEEEAAAGGTLAPDESSKAARTESPLEEASPERTESPLEEVSPERTESPLETVSAEAATDEPLVTASPSATGSSGRSGRATASASSSQAADTSASASPSATVPAIGASTSATAVASATAQVQTSLTTQTSVPGGLDYAVDPQWKKSSLRDGADTGVRVYDVNESTQFMLTYQEVGDILGSNLDRNVEILDKLIQAQGLWIGSEKMRHVEEAATVPYAWNSQFGQSSDLLSSEPNVTQVAAFSDGEYLYVAVWMSTGSLDASAEQWEAFLGSMELSGFPVWTDMTEE